MKYSSLALIGAILLGGATNAEAQHAQYGTTYTVDPGYHIDHHNHVVRDSHGQIIGEYEHDVLHKNSTHVLPHSGHHHPGTYYVLDGRYYHHPRTVSSSGGTYSTSYSPTEISFGGFSHVDDLAARLETLSNDFCLDLYYNYSHNPDFRVTYREAYQILQTAKYIHAAEHLNDRLAIQEKLGGLDQLFHHVEEDVQGWSRNHRRQFGHLGILSKMELMESTIHHLMNDVGVSPSTGGHITTTGGAGVAPPPPAP